jgi:hypothetical protein
MIAYSRACSVSVLVAISIRRVRWMSSGAPWWEPRSFRSQFVSALPFMELGFEELSWAFGAFAKDGKRLSQVFGQSIKKQLDLPNQPMGSKPEAHPKQTLVLKHLGPDTAFSFADPQDGGKEFVVF